MAGTCAYALTDITIAIFLIEAGLTPKINQKHRHRHPSSSLSRRRRPRNPAILGESWKTTRHSRKLQKSLRRLIISDLRNREFMIA